MTLRIVTLPQDEQGGFMEVECVECRFRAYTDSRITLQRLGRDHEDCDDE